MTAELSELQRDLGRVEGKIDIILDAVPKTDERIRRLESGYARMFGWAAGAGTVAGVVVSLIKGIF